MLFILFRTAGSDYSSQDYGTAEELKNVTKVIIKICL